MTVVTETHSIDEISAGQLDAHLAEVEERLVRRYTEVPAATVREVRRAETLRFADARVLVFVPVLVERAARERLEHLGATG